MYRQFTATTHLSNPTHSAHNYHPAVTPYNKTHSIDINSFIIIFDCKEFWRPEPNTPEEVSSANKYHLNFFVNCILYLNFHMSLDGHNRKLVNGGGE